MRAEPKAVNVKELRHQAALELFGKPLERLGQRWGDICPPSCRGRYGLHEGYCDATCWLRADCQASSPAAGPEATRGERDRRGSGGPGGSSSHGTRTAYFIGSRLYQSHAATEKKRVLPGGRGGAGKGMAVEKRAQSCFWAFPVPIVRPGQTGQTAKTRQKARNRHF